jgi:hypothetical protein
MTYAKTTVVSPERSRNEIEAILKRYGADTFAYAIEPERAMVGFRVKNMRVRFVLPLPAASNEEFTHRTLRGGWKEKRTELQAQQVYDQAIRSRWRALALCIKAKLETVESGITSFEQEFMPHLIGPDGRTLGETILPQYRTALTNGKSPPLLLPGV